MSDTLKKCCQAFVESYLEDLCDDPKCDRCVAIKDVVRIAFWSGADTYEMVREEAKRTPGNGSIVVLRGIKAELNRFREEREAEMLAAERGTDEKIH